MTNHPNRNKYSAFQRWWISVNKVLWARGLDEMNFEEARVGYEKYRSFNRADDPAVS